MRRVHPIFIGTVLGLLLVSGVPIFGNEVSKFPGVYFGGTLGFGVARIKHPEVADVARLGTELDLVFGWDISSHWGIGIELSSWQDTPLGVPSHLHTFAPRVDYTLDPQGDGLYFASAIGIAMTDGDVRKRFGFATHLGVGYRWSLIQWITLSLEGGMHAHLYSDGHALLPLVTIQLRFHGTVDSGSSKD